MIIRCETFEASLHNAPPYNALSYTWGLASDPHYPILLNGRTFYVRENLWLALYGLQTSADPVVIWIDAICIDQENIPERDHQVKKMKAIYEQADQVIVWLGPSLQQSKLAFRLVRELYGHRREDDWTTQRFKQPDMPKCLKALGSLFSRDYWYRVWIVQELTVAKRIVVKCGNDSIEGDVLLLVQELILKKDTRSNVLGMCIPGDIYAQSALRNQGLIEVQTWRDDFLIKDLSLFHCVLYHFRRRSTDPKDKLYGLLGLTSTLGNPGIEIDYSLTTAQIYTKFARNEIISSKRLHILPQSQPHLTDLEIPSWVPDWSAKHANHFFLQNISATSFNFTASGESESEITFLSDANILIAKAILMGSVEDFGGSAGVAAGLDLKQAVSTFHDNWRLVGTLPGDPRLNQEAFARTLLCGKVLEDRVDNREMCEFLRGILGGFAELSVEIYPHRILDPILSEHSNFIHSESARYAQASGIDYDKASESIYWRSWIETSVAYNWDRRFLIGSSGTMGMAPETSLEGDIICIPLGCPHPMVLRRVNNHYLVVGEAYVDRYMYGKAMELLKQGKLQLRDFELH